MRRQAKFYDPRMVSARVERSDAEKAEKIIGQQHHLCFQDFVNFSLRLFLSGTIYMDGHDFKLKDQQTEKDEGTNE